MPRFEKLGHVSLNVTDVDRSRHFYENMVGLAYSGGSDDVAFLRCSDGFQDVMLCQGAEAGLRHVGWEMESEQELEEVRRCLSENDIACRELAKSESDALHLGRTFIAVDPGTGLLNLFYYSQWKYGGEPFVAAHTRIQRLGHAVLQTPDFGRSIQFYRDILGFRVSDTFGDTVAFMRAFPNPYHHSLAIALSDRKRFAHLNFMVSEVDDIGRALWRFNKAEVPVVHGPGRHPPSGSMFLYFLDPDGLTIEYSFGMEEFDELRPRKPRQLERKASSMDYWGAVIDPRKAAIGAIQQSTVAR